jgi:hypothetical protein
MRARIRLVTAVTLVGMLIGAASALAAARLVRGAVYTGKSSPCGSTITGPTCVFRFRASANGRSLRFVGRTAVDTWRCRGGGGEALLGGKKGTPIPVVKVRANGTLYGSLTYTYRPSTAPPEHYRSTVTGHLANAGKKATITFHNTYLSSHGNLPCATGPVTLTAP